MLVLSFNKRRIKRRIGKGITNINNYNGYLKYADAYGCKKIGFKRNKLAKTVKKLNNLTKI